MQDSGLSCREMSETEREIGTQPACWERAEALGRSHPGLLPARGERIAVVGCGTSFHVATAYASLREDAGMGESDAFPASEFPTRRSYDRVVAISRSGTTTEVVHLLERLDGHDGRAPVLAITAAEDTPVARAADDRIALPFADERS